MADERDLIKSSLKEMIRRVPAKVSNGSIQMVREFKKFHATASKLSEQSSPPIEKLKSAYNQALQYYS